MSTTDEPRRDAAGIDGIALKPTEHRLERAADLAVDRLTIDFEGRAHVPEADLLRRLAADREVRVTVPVRADGFDPLGDDGALSGLPEEVGSVLVAGHPSYLSPDARERAIAPRLRAAARAAADPWIGTESIERLALAVGGTQFELLSGTTARDARALRAAGVEHELAVYAPTVRSSDPDVILDAVGDYVARRGTVADAIPEGAPRDSDASGAVREHLLDASERFGLVGDRASIAERVETLRAAGVDTIVAYPARGLESWF